MSVEKCIISKESSNFTIIPNKVLQGIQDMKVLGLWCYLLSLPPQWEFYKEHLRDHCRVGIHALNKILKTLEDYGLLSVEQKRDSKGKFSHFDMKILNGDNFKNNNIESYPQHLQKPYDSSRVTETVRTDISSYKYYKQKDNNKHKERAQKTRSSLSTSISDNNLSTAPIIVGSISEPADNHNFIPDESNQILCQDLALDLREELLSFNERHRGKKSQYEFGRWLKNSHQYHQQRSTTQKQEVRSTVPEYGPGHPAWELNQQLKREFGGSYGYEVSRSNIRGNGVQHVTQFTLSR